MAKPLFLPPCSPNPHPIETVFAMVVFKGIIDAENKHEPLSDDALTETLSSRGIEIARRTVSKHRDQLIPITPESCA